MLCGLTTEQPAQHRSPAAPFLPAACYSDSSSPTAHGILSTTAIGLWIHSTIYGNHGTSARQYQSKGTGFPPTFRVPCRVADISDEQTIMAPLAAFTMASVLFV